MENPVHDADVSFYRPFVYSTPSSGGLSNYPPRSTPPPPPEAPPPPPIVGANAPPMTPSNVVHPAPPPPLYLQPMNPEGTGLGQSPPDSPDAGSDAALITEDQSDTSNLSRGWRSTRNLGQSVSSKLSVFEN